MVKFGNKITTWKERWFVLTASAFRYYVTSEEKDLKGTIFLASECVIKVCFIFIVFNDIISNDITSSYLHFTRYSMFIAVYFFLYNFFYI